MDSSGTTSIGDLITYTITVSNTGDTTISGLSFIDTMVSSLGVTLTYSTPPDDSGCNEIEALLKTIN